MANQEIAKILFEFAELYDIEEVPFKPRAFERASESVGSLNKDIATVYKEEGAAGLEKIPGVGRGIAERIEEYLKTGRIKEYDALKKALEGIAPIG